MSDTKMADTTMITMPYQSAIANPQSTLLCLPQEIRDQIYTHVFSQTPMIFSWLNLHLLCTLSFLVPWINTCVSLLNTPNGLPSWILACKQLLSETLDFIARTHTFQRSRVSYPKNTNATQPLNPLIFSTGIRKIALCRLVKMSVEEENGVMLRRRDFAFNSSISIGNFLSVLKKTDARDMELQVHWELGLHRCSPQRPVSPLFFFNEHEAREWGGRFRKVMVEVTMLDDEARAESILGRLVGWAEKMAQVLVGQGAWMRGEERAQEWVPQIMEYKSWRVVVERKMG